MVITTTAKDGKNYKTNMLPIGFLSGWLFTIKKVAPALQAKLNLFRLEGYRALDAWFRQGLRNDPVVKEKYPIPESYADALELAAKQAREMDLLHKEKALVEKKRGGWRPTAVST